jgi:hypothetical protein
MLGMLKVGGYRANMGRAWMALPFFIAYLFYLSIFLNAYILQEYT